MPSIFFIIISCCLFIICVILVIALFTTHGVIEELTKRKVKASPELIEAVEKEMIKALRYHNLKKYHYYRQIFNDLQPIEDPPILY